MITSGSIFDEKTTIYQNWVQGEKYEVNNENWNDINGIYKLLVKADNGTKEYTLAVKNAKSASVIDGDTLSTKFSFNGKMVSISFPPEKKSKSSIRLSGTVSSNAWEGIGANANGTSVFWSANFVKATDAKPDTTKKSTSKALAKITYPYEAVSDWDQTFSACPKTLYKKCIDMDLLMMQPSLKKYRMCE